MNYGVTDIFCWLFYSGERIESSHILPPSLQGAKGDKQVGRILIARGVKGKGLEGR